MFFFINFCYKFIIEPHKILNCAVYTLQDSDGDKSDDLVVDVSNEVKANSLSLFCLENIISFICD